VIRIEANVQTPEEATCLLFGLALLCERQIRLLHLPALLRSGVRYQREPVVDGERREWWQSAAETYRLKAGDCEDLVGYRVGEIWASGVPRVAPGSRGTGARPDVYRSPAGVWHCIVWRCDGKRVWTEDPSKTLGM
jgi:hypothetical protein